MCAAGCALHSPPERPGSAQALANGHREPIAPIGVAALDLGVAGPSERIVPEPGDRLVYALDLETEAGAQRWLVSISCEARVAEDGDGVVPMRIELFDTEGNPVASKRRLVPSAPLALGLYSAAAILAKRKRLDEEERARLKGTPGAMKMVLDMLVGHRETQALWRVVRRPSLFSLLAHWGLVTHYNLARAEPFDHGLPGWDCDAYRLPATVSLNGVPAAGCSLVVVPPRAPLTIGAGVVSLVVVRPDDHAVRLRLTLVGAESAQ